LLVHEPVLMARRKTAIALVICIFAHPVNGGN
jgi:hypothetical protein